MDFDVMRMISTQIRLLIALQVVREHRSDFI